MASSSLRFRITSSGRLNHIHLVRTRTKFPNGVGRMDGRADGRGDIEKEPTGAGRPVFPTISASQGRFVKYHIKARRAS